MKNEKEGKDEGEWNGRQAPVIHQHDIMTIVIISWS
jgi:hypothetical protein